MVTHSSTLAWRIPWMEKPGRLQSTGLQTVGHDWATSLTHSLSQGYGFSCGHVWMWELDCEEGWVPKNWCFWTVVLEKTLESPLDFKEIQPVHSKGDQSWMFIGRNDTKDKIPVLWPPHAKSWLIGKDSDAGRDWGQEEKRTTGWDCCMASPTLWTWVWVNSRSWWWTGRPACCNSRGCKESDMTERLNWTELTIYSPDILLSQFGTSLLFHVQFKLLFLTCIQISKEAGEVI